MRRFLIFFLITTLLLTACGTLEVDYLDGDSPVLEITATDSPAANPAPLSMDSTSSEIRQRLFESPLHWQTIFVEAQVTENGTAPRRVQVWVDQSALSFRTLSGPVDGKAETYRAADGMSLLEMDLQTGASDISPFLSETISLPYFPVAPSQYPTDTIQSQPLTSYVDSHLGTMLFPSDIAQNQGTFKPVAMEVVDYKLTLVVEWTYIQNELPSYRAWVDIATGVFLRYQRFEKSGGESPLSEIIVTRVIYDLPIPSSFFSPNVTALPDFANDPLSIAVEAPTPAAPEGYDPLGMVYAYVAENGSSVRAMRLVRIPASCALGESDCPQAEEIETPVALTSSLQPMAWSPKRNEAAWTYPMNKDQRIWTLYLFNAEDNSWKELAQMDRYMDPPMWSRSGEWISFRAQDGDGNEAVYAVRRDGSGLKNLTDSKDLPAEGRPYIVNAWLGENIILHPGTPDGTGTIYLMRAEDGFVKPLFETALTKSTFVPSPDASLLAFVEYEGNNQKQLIKIITPDGKTLRDLATFVSGSVMELTWSPDGQQLGFVLMTESASTVYVIDNDGRNLRQVFMSATDAHYVFSPDGKSLFVKTIDGTGEHVYAVNLSTLDAHLVQVPGIGLNEAWVYIFAVQPFASAANSTMVVPSPTIVATISPTVDQVIARYENPTYGYSISHPVSFKVKAQGDEFVELGDQIVISASENNPASAQGGGHVFETSTEMEIGDYTATLLTGYTGAIGGYIPQQFRMYVFERNGLYFTFKLYALGLHAQGGNLSQVVFLNPDDVERFDELILTVQFK
jgi:WD40 repeat protein